MGRLENETIYDTYYIIVLGDWIVFYVMAAAACVYASRYGDSGCQHGTGWSNWPLTQSPAALPECELSTWCHTGVTLLPECQLSTCCHTGVTLLYVAL